MYTLPDLPYSYNALEPYIDEATMHIHHDKHHAAYVDKLNKSIENYPDLFAESIENHLKNLNKLSDDIKKQVKNFGGGHANHSFFWNIMIGGSSIQPSGNLLNEINKTFSSLHEFKKQFTDAAVAHFGSGWTWLVLENKSLQIVSTLNQDSPLSEGKIPLLTCDLWEHAYYLKYQNRRPDYIEAWWNVVNWNKVEEIFEKATKE